MGELGHGGEVVSFAFPDSNNCYVLDQFTDTTFIYKIIDQGESLKLHKTIYPFNDAPPILITANKLVAPTKDYLFMTFDQYAYIKKSTDGGKSFERIKLNDSTLYEIIMRDTTVGIAIGSDGEYSHIFTTRDGWKTFKKLDTSFKWGFYSPIFKDSANIQMVYLNFTPRVETLVNYNITTNEWTVLYNLDADTTEQNRIVFTKLIYVSDSTRYLTGSKGSGEFEKQIGEIYKTEDGGKHWEKNLEWYEKPYGDLQDIAFFDEKNGIAVGARVEIFMTNDGGSTWHYERPDEMIKGWDSLVGGSPYLHVAWSGKTPLVGTYSGKVFRYYGDFYKIGKMKPPKLIWPENNSIAQINSTQLLWSSNEVLGHFYYVEISKDKEFKNDVEKTTFWGEGETNGIGTTLYDFTQYYWRVGILDTTSKIDTIWSDTFTFRTSLAQIEPVSPDCGTTNQNTDVNLIWKAAKGAQYYRLQLAAENQFDTVLIEKDSIPVNHCVVDDLDSGKTYFWRVLAFNNEEEGHYYPTCYFTTLDPSDVREAIPGGTINIKQSDELLTFYVESKDHYNYQIEIIDLSGNSIFKSDLKTVLNIDLSQFMSGTYLYKLTTNRSLLKSGKFIVTR